METSFGGNIQGFSNRDPCRSLQKTSPRNSGLAISSWRSAMASNFLLQAAQLQQITQQDLLEPKFHHVDLDNAKHGFLSSKWNQFIATELGRNPCLSTGTWWQTKEVCILTTRIDGSQSTENPNLFKKCCLRQNCLAGRNHPPNTLSRTNSVKSKKLLHEPASSTGTRTRARPATSKAPQITIPMNWMPLLVCKRDHQLRSLFITKLFTPRVPAKSLSSRNQPPTHKHSFSRNPNTGQDAHRQAVRQQNHKKKKGVFHVKHSQPK